MKLWLLWYCIKDEFFVFSITVLYCTVQYVYHVYLFSAYDPSLFDMKFTLCIRAEWVQNRSYISIVLYKVKL
jgi:hypothetical protein